MNELMSWYSATTSDDTVNAVASRAGLVGSTLSRQLKAETLTPESIVAIARAYNADAIEGLIISGLITEADVSRHGAQALLESITDRMIANEVWRRMADGSGHPEFSG